jgi:hypothetical protein
MMNDICLRLWLDVSDRATCPIWSQTLGKNDALLEEPGKSKEA